MEYHRIVFEQCLGVYLRNVLPAESDCALIDIPETCGELSRCALATARGTYQRRHLALPSGKRHVAEHLLARLVREVDTVERYIVVIDRIIGCSLLYGHRLHLFYSVDMHVENSQYCNVIEYLADRVVYTCRYHQEDKVGKHIYRTDRQEVGTDDDDRRHTEFEYRIGRIDQDTSDKFAFGKTLFVTTEAAV